MIPNGNMFFVFIVLYTMCYFSSKGCYLYSIGESCLSTLMYDFVSSFAYDLDSDMFPNLGSHLWTEAVGA